MFGYSTIGQLPAPYSPFGVPLMMNHPPISATLLGAEAINMNGTTIPSFPFVTRVNFPQSNSQNLGRFLQAELDAIKCALLPRAQS